MYKTLSEKISNLIEKNQKENRLSPYCFSDESAIRRTFNPHDKPSVIRSNFIKDIDKIINCPFFSRYHDKTQVFSLYKNDDITRRSGHVQFVSRIARTLGKTLGLNQELIEAVSLGHDIGHTPFGHAGEYVLNDLSLQKGGGYFNHNVQSVRVLDDIFSYNITLQTLDGILCHNGEIELSKYEKGDLKDFAEFDKNVENCYKIKDYSSVLKSGTLEGCVVRIADIIAYLGKDRQDALNILEENENYVDFGLGTINAEIINNLTVNIVENSYFKPYIKMDDDIFKALKIAKKENYEKIYFNKVTQTKIKENLSPMMEDLFNRFVLDLKNGNKNSFVFTHHVDLIEKGHYKRKCPYIEQDIIKIAIDYIASMTDDYFVEIYKTLFPNSKYKLEYTGYFD